MLATWPTLPWRRPSLESILQMQPASQRTRSTTSWAMVVGATSAAGETILHRDPITGLRHYVVAGLKVELFKGRPPVRTCQSNVIGMPSTTLDLTHRCKYHWEVVLNNHSPLSRVGVLRKLPLYPCLGAERSPGGRSRPQRQLQRRPRQFRLQRGRHRLQCRLPVRSGGAQQTIWWVSPTLLVCRFSLSKHQVKAQPLDLTQLQDQPTHPHRPTRPTQPIQQIHLIHKEGASPTL